ncbi:hypothetical protein PYH37_003841 [Sinorhizobium numidicum]|uniref:hypothetical protein n=1 Tax=Sinorhizobium numidicum TaxID=680248 RepID=UPI002474EA0D|nr:hypothetical protein [Sinorhizobium numidicum]WEX78896.1 hypothetical protein PYH37_003841 [Sinorhizobium numidicum]
MPNIANPEVLAGREKPTTTRLWVRLREGRLRADVFVPANPQASVPPLLALHGISRAANALSTAFAPLTAAAGRVLIVPRFPPGDWPVFQRIGGARPDKPVLALLARLQAMGLADTRKVDLFGFSGGAQLAHRFAMLYPQHVAALHVAAAGWYCLPDDSVPFPMGLRTEANMVPPGESDIAGLMLAQLSAFLKLPLRIYVGEDDRLRDPALRRDRRIDALQGRDRVARAHAFAAAFKSAAHARGIVPTLSFTVLPGCGHDFPQCAQAAGLAAQVCGLSITKGDDYE